MMIFVSHYPELDTIVTFSDTIHTCLLLAGDVIWY